ncbi:MAG: tRNA lysidine(34) synthetase TilS [Proteobacteria bacterium]|nr:tRNA lysidine(34) synthetase TilS [Pseudomonadota bacterium]
MDHGFAAGSAGQNEVGLVGSSCKGRVRGSFDPRCFGPENRREDRVFGTRGSRRHRSEELRMRGCAGSSDWRGRQARYRRGNGFGMSEPYPKPGETGGTLIRRVLGLFKKQGFALPFDRPVLIAVSGGVDSMVLAHLLSRYGRKVVPKELITLLHLDHGWRKESASVERDTVRELASDLGTGFLARDLEPPSGERRSENLEEDGRIKRLEVYESLAGPGLPYEAVLTAHHRDDLAETVFFRFLRGEFDLQRDGIRFLDSVVVRPLLDAGKQELLNYAKEEGIEFHEDPGNRDPAFFRAWVRQSVFPMIEERYPGARERIARYAEGIPDQSSFRGPEEIENLVGILNGPLNRAQREWLRGHLAGMGEGAVVHLSGRAQLKRLKNGWLIENPDPANQA